jgi:adenosylmethionine-8-amino-7-oxononanoate aminotransferase
VIGDRIVFAPPLVIEEDEIGEIGERLPRALDEAASELKREAAVS